MMLDREEIVEQAYFFRSLRERLELNLPLQDLLANLREEILSTTKLPMAIDFLLSELLHLGVLGPAMQRLSHYFTAFQTYVITEAESERGRFDLRIGLEILEREATYKGESCSPAGVFLYQFEAICRNRLRYDPGLAAASKDPIFTEDWRVWIDSIRMQIGIVDLADLLYLRSQHHVSRQRQHGLEPDPLIPILFGEKEGKIALANRLKEPLLLLSALHRQLGYPAVPRPKPSDDKLDMVPQLSRRVERLEARIKLLEEEQKGGIDITKFYGKDSRSVLGSADEMPWH